MAGLGGQPAVARHLAIYAWCGSRKFLKNRGTWWEDQRRTYHTKHRDRYSIYHRPTC